jgi:hypothetical protein
MLKRGTRDGGRWVWQPEQRACPPQQLEQRLHPLQQQNRPWTPLPPPNPQRYPQPRTCPKFKIKEVGIRDRVDSDSTKGRGGSRDHFTQINDPKPIHLCSTKVVDNKGEFRITNKRRPYCSSLIQGTTS